MNGPNLLKVREPRCAACRLPAEVLAGLHRERFEDMATFAGLAAGYGSADHSLSESGLRRHFANHALAPDEADASQADEGEAPEVKEALSDAAPPGELDGHAVLEASTKALTEMMANLVREHRAVVAQNPREAERLLGMFMKVQGQLQRALKDRDQGRARKEEFRKAIRPIIKRIGSEAVDSIISLMRDNGRKVREDFSEVAHQRIAVDEFWNRLSTAENTWAMEVATRMRKATADALQAEEESYARGTKKGRAA